MCTSENALIKELRIWQTGAMKILAVSKNLQKCKRNLFIFAKLAMKCTGGRIYKACGPAKGQPGCGATVEINDENEPCVEGCFCPEGTVLHNDKCITKDKCPCKLRGKTFQPGQSVPKECNTCICNQGQWVCTQVILNLIVYEFKVKF